MKTVPLFGQILEPTEVRYVQGAITELLDMFQPLLDSIRIYALKCEKKEINDL